MNRSDETTPIINILRSEDIPKEFVEEWLLTSFVIGNHKVNAHKKRLGRQNYCFTGFHRYWVWETDLWRVYVNNRQGLSLEVPVNFTPEQVKNAISDYKKKMGVTPKRIESMRLKMVSRSKIHDF